MSCTMNLSRFGVWYSNIKFFKTTNSTSTMWMHSHGCLALKFIPGYNSTLHTHTHTHTHGLQLHPHKHSLTRCIDTTLASFEDVFGKAKVKFMKVNSRIHWHTLTARTHNSTLPLQARTPLYISPDHTGTRGSTESLFRTAKTLKKFERHRRPSCLENPGLHFGLLATSFIIMS